MSENANARNLRKVVTQVLTTDTVVLPAERPGHIGIVFLAMDFLVIHAAVERVADEDLPEFTTYIPLKSIVEAAIGCRDSEGLIAHAEAFELAATRLRKAANW